MKNWGKKKILLFKYAILVLGLIIAGVGMISSEFNVIVVGIMLLWFFNIVYALEKFQERLFFFFFQITLFTFIIGRPFIGLCKGIDWWNTSQQGEDNVMFSLYAIVLTLVFMYLGTVFATKTNRMLKKQKKYMKPQKQKNGGEFRAYLHAVAMIVFYITILFFFIQEFEKLAFMRGKNYVEFYVEFKSSLPIFFHTIASFMKYSLCIFLATFPSKRRAFIPLCLYELSAIPALIIGLRNPIVLNSIFIVVYYLIRDIKEDRVKWIGRVERISLIIVTPLMIAFMAAYSYIRGHEAIVSKNPFSMIIEFFRGQSVSFEVLAIGYGWRGALPNHSFGNYTFGGMIDYAVYGNFGQKLWGTNALPDGNSVINGTLSHSLAHNLSYVSKQNEYLSGQGWGSSYLLESYIDYGYVGIVIISLILGALLIYGIYWFKRNYLINAIILISLTSIFFTPRAETTGWLEFLVTLQFWACILMCFGGAWICLKCEPLQRVLGKIGLLPKIMDKS